MREHNNQVRDKPSRDHHRDDYHDYDGSERNGSRHGRIGDDRGDRMYSSSDNNYHRTRDRDNRDRSRSPDRRPSAPPQRYREDERNEDRRRDYADSGPRSERRDHRDHEPRHAFVQGRDSSSQPVPPPPPPKEKPNYGVSGALAAEGNTFKGVLLKYSEPPEARKPTKSYRLYIFKGKEQVDMLQVSRQSAYMFGRERIVADIPIDHLSCSKQHAVLQYRHTAASEDGQQRVIKPYLIDLGSSNGTFLNGTQVSSSRYYELKVGDTIKFGNSTRDYVFMCEDDVV